MDNCKFIDVNSYMNAIVESQVEKGSWRKTNFINEVEETKVLLQ